MRTPSKKLTRELQVGVFVIVAFIVIAAFSFRITESPIYRRGTTLVTYVDDATGLFQNSRVKIAGIDVGAIRKIELEDGKAKLTLILNTGVEVPGGAHVEPRPLGILGDKYIEIVLPKPPASPTPGATEGAWWRGVLDAVVPSARAQTGEMSAGAVPGPPLKSGDVIRSENSAATMDDLLRQLGAISQDVKQLTKKLNGVVDENRADVHEMIQALNRTSRKLETVFDKLDADKLGEDVRRLGDAAGNIGRSAERVENVLRKVDEGEGTVGKLINDPAVANELQRSLEILNSALDRVARTQLAVDLRAEYYPQARHSKTYATLAIRPREDIAYVGQVVIDPQGTFHRTVTTTTTDGGVPVVEDVVVNDREAVYFSLLFEKRLYDLAFRVGLMENRGGFSLDYGPFGERLVLTLDLFKLTRDGNRPHMKVSANYRFLDYFYVSVGGDELLSRVTHGAGRPSLLLGAGLRFVDEDLRTALLIPGLP